MAVAPSPAYQEVYYFLASRPTHAETTQAHIHHLLQANKDGRLSADEQAELDAFENVEHFVRMLKLHTRQLMDKK